MSSNPRRDVTKSADTEIDRGAITDDEPLGELFDPTVELVIHEGKRPHGSQPYAVVFVTFRTKDSIPSEVIERWNREKIDWLNRRGLLLNQNWKEALQCLDQKSRNEFKRHFNRCREDFLDACAGECVLRRPECASIVADSLMHFDRQRYRMGDFVVMPNHVHLLAAFSDSDGMKKQFDSWLHFTAFEINKVLGRNGHFWQQEPFDHLVRSNDQYDYFREYIRDNPRKANLSEGEFIYRR